MSRELSRLTGRHGLGFVRTIIDFREYVDNQPKLDEADRKLLVEQAIILIRDLYVHLPLKKAMHAVDPVQRLRLLETRLLSLSDREFHAELLGIFNDLRDLHTNYVLPVPFSERIAFLGILVEQYYQHGQPRWMVSKVAEHFVTDPNLKEGVLLQHWNGMPMDLAVWRNADKEAGSNIPARLARGLESMTLRYLNYSLPPDEDWVDLVFDDGGQVYETRLAWHVFDSGRDIVSGSPDPGDLWHDIKTPLRYQLGMDYRTEMIRRAKKRLFAPAAVREERRIARYDGRVPRATVAQKKSGVIPTSRSDEITAKILNTSYGSFGYLRLWTFHMAVPPGHPSWRHIDAYIQEVKRLLDEEFPPEGLIIDVRGNGGGYVFASEALLQMLTPSSVEPTPFQFANTAATLALTDVVSEKGKWRPSLLQGITTGAMFSRDLPFWEPEVINEVGQVYHGPIVLITDAFCYSACDMFAASFQDHSIGLVMGVDENTGAGGANVESHSRILIDWPFGPLTPLPAGAEMRVAIRRSLRVGERDGDPLEDLGVVPDVVVDMTRDDLLFHNRDLLENASAWLHSKTRREFKAAIDSVTGSDITLKIATLNVPEIDIYVNERPQESARTPDGTTKVTVQATPASGANIRLEGYENGALVASRKLTVP